jgi:hypothetical protein
MGGQPGTLMTVVPLSSLWIGRGAGRVGLGRLHAAVGSATAPGDHRLGAGRRFFEISNEVRPPIMQYTPSASVGTEPSMQSTYSPLYFSIVSRALFCLMPGGGHQGFGVVKRQFIQQNIGYDGVGRADKTFTATGAFLKVQPNHRHTRASKRGLLIFVIPLYDFCHSTPRSTFSTFTRSSYSIRNIVT